MSSQILALEQDLGTKLFERTPFRLTPVGEKLYAFVRPFFANVESVAATLRQHEAPCLRVGAVEMVMRDHLHTTIQHLRTTYPRLQLSMRPGFTPQILTWLEDRQIDMAIGPVHGPLPPPMRALRLMRPPLVLQVPRRSKVKSAAQVLAQRPLEETLITLPATETISRIFRRELQRRRIKWAPAIEASSLLAVTRYVAHGHGIGVNVDTEVARHPKVRVLPLDGFPPLEVAVVWNGEPTPVISAFLQEAKRYVKKKWPGFYCAGA